MRSMRAAVLLFVLLTVSLSLSACGGDDEPTPQPPPTPAAAVAVEEAQELGGSESDEATEDATDEATATPTDPPPSPSPEPSLTAGSSPTPWPTATRGPLPAGLPTADPDSWPSSHLSPDGRWWVRDTLSEEVAVVNGRYQEDPETGEPVESWYYRGQQIISTDGSIVHEVIDEWSHFGMGYPAPTVLGWTPDSRWVYLYETGNGDGCGLYSWGSDLRRLDPQTGELQYLQDRMPGAPTLSPDGATVAFIFSPRLVLLNPDEGRFLEALIPGSEDSTLQAGIEKYNADGTLEFVVDYQPCSDAWTRAMARFDPATGRVELQGTPAPQR